MVSMSSSVNVCGVLSPENVAALSEVLKTCGCVVEIIRRDGFSKYYASRIDGFDETTYSVCRHRVFFKYASDGSGPFPQNFSHVGDEHTDYFDNQHLYYLHNWKLREWNEKARVYPPHAGSLACAVAAAAFLEKLSGIQNTPFVYVPEPLMELARIEDSELPHRGGEPTEDALGYLETGRASAVDLRNSCSVRKV